MVIYNSGRQDFRIIRRKLTAPLVRFPAFLILTCLLSGTLPAFATDYSITMSTSSSVEIIAQSGGVVIDDSDINVITNCQAGYNLTMHTSVNDNTLYLGGNNSNTTNSSISPVNGTSLLKDTENAWGYYNTTPSDETAPTINSVFSPVPPLGSTPATIRNQEQTSSAEDIDDNFKIYFGASASILLSSGTYRLINDTTSASPGGIYYQLTASPSCTSSAEVLFNKNLDGAGGESGEEVNNFPTSSDNTIDTTNHTITLSSKRPVRTGYQFKEWNTEADGTGDYYHVGETIPTGQDDLSGFVTLYAIWVEDCASATVCYDGNHEDAGTMPAQTDTAGSTVNLIAPNFSRTGYGFTGWNTRADGTGTQYGPNENITIPSSTGITLFAQWLAPTGTLQTWSGASSMNTGDVIALRDKRDNEVYTVAKLADGNIWITENLRLLPNTANITAHNTHNPTENFVTAAPSSSPTTASQCSGNNATCNNQIYFYPGNIDRTNTAAATGTTIGLSWYAYGVLYNWYTATAGNGLYAQASGDTTGDICPAGWHLPTGGTSGEYNTLANTLGGSSTAEKSNNVRKYPNNFVYAGDFNPSKSTTDNRGVESRYWSSTASEANKAYRFGLGQSNFTPTNTWNKFTDFAVRCIYQGGNVHYADLNVNFSGTGITSLTFTASGQDTQTATPQNNTIELAQDVAYTATATTTAGYEVASWSTSTGATLGNTSTTNPAVNPNTYTVTSDEATLTITGQETPIYAVTATLGEHVTSISFTNSAYGIETITPASQSCTDNNDDTYTCSINLRRGVEYTITATFEEGYTITTWTTGAGGTLGNPTAVTTTYTITSATTLGITTEEADELNYTLIYSAGAGTDAPTQGTKSSFNTTESFTITNSTPIYYGYTFTGWSETAVDATNCDNTNGNSNCNGTTVDYVSGDTITLTSTSVTTTKTLYPVYTAVSSCPADNICYYDNGADVNGGGRGTMSNQSASSSTLTVLVPTNYSRVGYGFAGWVTDANATPYGPNASVTTPDISSTGLSLYAKWIKSEGDLQSWRGCNSMNTNQVIALTDTRDNNTYAVAKLADGNCWTIENLRLDPGLATITTQNTHNPTSDFITESTTDGAGTPASLSSNTLCGTDNDSECIDQIQYNANSLDRTLTPKYNQAGNNVAWYSYGVYYNWYTATAGNGTTSNGSNSNVNGDICPKNWHIPTGNNGEWVTLGTALGGSYDANLRAYPVNLLRSGDYNKTSRTNAQTNGRYWTATAYDSGNAYRAGFQDNTNSLNGNYRKWDALTIRCIRDEITAELYDLTVTLPTGVESITFTNSHYGTETATAQNPVVSLAENTSYTMTATMTPGYELTQWQNGVNSTISDSTANPTTITITGNTTLTATTAVIPTYTVTVNLDAHSTSVTFTNASYGTQNVTQVNATANQDGSYTGTVSLRRGVEYTIAGTFDTANDYTFNSWSTTTGGALGSTTSRTTTYIVTGTTTLSLTSKQKTGQTTLLPGQELNAKMKTLAEGTSTSYATSSSKIKSLRMADSLPTGFTPSSANTVSVEGSEKPIYIFFDNTNDAGIMYFYTDAKDIYMNADSSYAFYYNTTLTDISAVSSWNTGSVTDMGEMFEGTYSLTNIDALANWDTNSVTDMSYMFSDARALTNIDGASDWNTSSVTNMSGMFYVASALTNIDGASNWDTRNVRKLSEGTSIVRKPPSGTVASYFGIFQGARALTNIDGAANWDTSNVTSMSTLFAGTDSLTNIDALANWNTSNVTGMYGMFYGASALTNIDGASSWNTGNVTNMRSMFQEARALTNIDGASNWNTSSVTDMSYMFYNTRALTNASGANNWDVRSVTATAGSSSSSSNNFYYMFSGAGGSFSNPAHPTFTTRSGTWNSEGTFIPGDTTSGTVTTTVNFGSHISNIKFYGLFPGSSSSTTQTISTSSGTISLNRGYSYQITATLDSGYELALWDPGEHGVIPTNRLTMNSRDYDYTDFTPTGDTTLTATSQPIPSDITTTVNMDSNITRVSFCNDKYNAYNSGAGTYDCAIATPTGSTVTLKQGATYRVTTTTKQGYEVSSYTATGSTITSTTGPHTDFTPSGDSSLTITSTTNASTHTVTVNMDSNVSYVTFTNPDWPSKTAIRNGSTVDLRDNTQYTATAYTKYGYALSSWTTTSAGTLSSTTTNPTTITVTGDSTLTVASEPIPTYTTTVNLDSGIRTITISNPRYGTQEITSNNTPITLYEGIEYTITAETKDGSEFSSWSTDSNGTLSSTTDNPAVFTISGTSTLSASTQALPTHQVTVNLDQGISSIGFYNADLGTQQVTTTGSTVNLYDNTDYIITAATNTGFNFATWTAGTNATIGSATANPTTLTVTGSTTLSATTTDNRILINYDGNGLYYNNDPINTVNQVYYENTKSTTTETITRYAHTANVSDAGVASGNYANNLNTTDTVTIDGATSLNVTVYYDAESATYDWVSVYQSPFTISNTNDATISATTGNLSGKLTNRKSGRTTNYTSWYSQTYTVTGDTVKFHFKSDGSSQYYGYYAIITADVTTTTGSFTPISGTYAVPSSSDPHTFLGWSENQNATAPTYTDEQDIMDNSNYHHSDSPVTLYAIYQTLKTVTVNMDSRTTSVSFYNANHGIQTATPSSPTVSLYANTEYITTATFSTGYAFGTWSTTANGILSSTTTNPTTYTITDTATLTVTSNLATQTVTVYLHTNVTSVSFTNSDYSTQTVNADHGTATLYHGVPYTITATVEPNSRYVFSNWTTSANGTLTDANANPTTYTVTGNATLTPNIEKIKHSVTVNFDSGVSSVIFHKSPYLNQTVTTSGNTVNLAEDEAYTVTTRLNNGYVFTSYTTAANGTLTSTTDNPTAYTVTNSSTLTITTTAIPTHTVTVNMDSNVTSVSFSNQNYATETVSTSGGTATLREGVLYQVSSTYNTGYTADSWTTTANGTLSNTTQSNNTYIITGDATLSLTSREEVATTLLPGDELNTKMKTLAEGKSTSYGTESSKIKSLQMADSLPSGFTPSSANTVSTSSSTYPVYIFFDNTDDAGIIYFYTEARDIYMNANSRYAFCYNTALTDISAVSGWDTSSVTNMTYMFWGATALTNIDALANWDISSVTVMSAMFLGATALTNIDGASSWNTSSVTSMSSMFYRAIALTNIDGASNWNTSSVTDMRSMFSDATSLTNIDGATNWGTGNVTKMGDYGNSSFGMFSGATALTNIDALANWDTSSVTNMTYMFLDATALTNIDGASNWNTSSVTNMYKMFYNASSLTNIDGASNWNTGNVTSMSYMFSNATSLTNIDGASNWNTSSVTNMSYMFSYARALTNIDALSSWDTSNVTNVSGMFDAASSLVSIDALANWDTSRVANMSYMFDDASSLTNIDGASNWNTSSVTDMSAMFYGASALTNIDALANWDTSRVANMSYMFDAASSLVSIDALTNWNTGSVTDMSYMFSYASRLTDASGANNWDVRSVTATAGDSSNNNKFYQMFNQAGGSSSNPTHPTFTTRSGTWNSDGTFIPSDTTPTNSSSPTTSTTNNTPQSSPQQIMSISNISTPSQPAEQNENTDNSTDNNTDSNYAEPHGVSINSSNENQSTSPDTTLLIIATTATALGIGCFVYAKRDKNEDEE